MVDTIAAMTGEATAVLPAETLGATTMATAAETAEAVMAMTCSQTDEVDAAMIAADHVMIEAEESVARIATTCASSSDRLRARALHLLHASQRSPLLTSQTRCQSWRGSVA